MRCLSVVLMSLGLFATSCAAVGPAPGGGAAQPSPREATPGPPPSGFSISPEAAPADGAISHAASELSRELTGDDRFASVEVLEGNRIVVHWHGPVDSKLRDLLNRFPGLQISVEKTLCSPGRLSDYGSELLASDPAVNIVSVAPDGSSLRLTLDESVKATSDVAALERKYSEAVGCPVKSDIRGHCPSRWVTHQTIMPVVTSVAAERDPKQDDARSGFGSR